MDCRPRLYPATNMQGWERYRRRRAVNWMLWAERAVWCAVIASICALYAQ
jgi:hypothetical protein